MSKNLIEEYLLGKNNREYATNIEPIPNTNKCIVFFNDIKNNKKWCEVMDYTPFVYTKDIVELFYNGNKKEKYYKKAIDDDIKIVNLEKYGYDRLKNGYVTRYESDKSFEHITKFFSEVNLPLYDKEDELSVDRQSDEWKQKKKESFMNFPKVEQFCISNSFRFFKGIDKYEDLHKMYFDIETSGLDANEEGARLFQIGVGFNYDYLPEGNERIIILEAAKENDDDAEREIIMEFFRLINQSVPDMIIAYNCFNFDWPFIFDRCKKLNINPNYVIQPKHAVIEKRGKGFEILKDNFDRKKVTKFISSNVKIGNESERYNKFSIFGYTIVDSAHSVRKAQSQDASIEEWGLKYISKRVGFAKEDRVYIEGHKIYETWINDYLFLAKNNSTEYIKIPSNLVDSLRSYYKKVKRNSSLNEEDLLWLNNKTIKNFIGNIDNEIDIYNDIEFDVNKESTDKKFYLVKGKNLVREYLRGDIYETMKVDDKYSQAPYYVSKITPANLERVWTMGTAAIWKLYMTGWYYHKNTALPSLPENIDNVGGLNKILKVGYIDRVFKADFSGLYPSLGTTYNFFPIFDVDKVMSNILDYIGVARNKYKKLKKQYESQGDYEMGDYYDKLQSPLKLIRNSYYGAMTATIFPWADTTLGESIPAYGRMHMRKFVEYMVEKGYEPLVMNTDGCNFKLPDDKTVDDAKNDINIYNKDYLPPTMEVEFEGYYPATINFKKNNYVDLVEGKKGNYVKMVGGILGRKTQPNYIKKFIASSIKHLLNNDGVSFYNEYKEMVIKICNQCIPAVDIADKNKVKMTIEQYLEYKKGTNKNGGKLPDKVFMELMINNNINKNLGEIVYSINYGTKVSNKGIEFIKLIDPDTIENISEHLESYNVASYLDKFNSAIKPFTIVFKPEVRKYMIANNENELRDFTPEELQLTYEVYNPLIEEEIKGNKDPKVTDVGEIKNVYILDYKELIFWGKKTYKLPDFIFKNYINTFIYSDRVVITPKARQKLLKEVKLMKEVLPDFILEESMHIDDLKKLVDYLKKYILCENGLLDEVECNLVELKNKKLPSTFVEWADEIIEYNEMVKIFETNNTTLKKFIDVKYIEIKNYLENKYGNINLKMKGEFYDRGDFIIAENEKKLALFLCDEQGNLNLLGDFKDFLIN